MRRGHSAGNWGTNRQAVGVWPSGRDPATARLDRSPATSRSSGEPSSGGSSSERRLLDQARRGSRAAVDALFGRYRPWLRRWARGRMPPWARDGIDTSDVIHDALHHTFARLDSFESRHAGVLRAYLQRAVENRIRDQLRRATRRLDLILPDASVRATADAAPQHQQLIDDETWSGYLGGLRRLTDRDRRLVVGRAELGYSYRQLALVERLPSADAARKAVGRALRRLVDAMSKA